MARIVVFDMMGVRGIALSAAGLLVVVITAAANAATPTARVNVTFAKLPHGWVVGIPRDVRADSRIVGTIGGHQLAVGPTRNGNFCEAFSGGSGGCRGRSAGVFGPTILSDDGRQIAAVAGDVLTTSPTALLYVKFGSSKPRLARMIWVSRPIGAGFYFIAAPPGQKTAQLFLREGSKTIAASEIMRMRIR